MERVEISLPCGRTMLVDVKTAARVQKQVEKNRDKSIRIARELKAERMLPGFRSQLAGWNSEVHHRQPEAEVDNRESWREGKHANTETRWQEFLQMENNRNS